MTLTVARLPRQAYWRHPHCPITRRPQLRLLVASCRRTSRRVTSRSESYLAGPAQLSDAWERSLYQDLDYLPGTEIRNGKRLWLVREDQVLTDEYHANISTLFGARLVQECWHAAAVLKVETNRTVEDFTPDVPRRLGFGGCDRDRARRLAEARGSCLSCSRLLTTIWFALGTLLGGAKRRGRCRTRARSVVFDTAAVPA